MDQLRNWAYGWPKDDGFIGKVIDLKLQPGTLIDRYGAPTGRFVSPVGPSFGSRALAGPEGYENYYVDEVLRPLDVKSGAASLWFGEVGGARQYILPGRIVQLIEQGALRRVKVVPGSKKWGRHDP
ncbi:hypothetical protein GCM10008955_26720 [Deinococcus malanensis]|uniref:TNT domain-containing protein n=1 Tax=Deinococcus malanensis TaxID=1706855 RepID=A0ABQ2EY92_9DEIO|nr:TNT domain-containing protein [Deinococcus malanensis]GGK31538.1 hypothetical protein GCM10008955_26720 [Deinococcus malanensis]